MAGPTVGREAKTYYNTGSFASPTWTLIDRIVDLDWDMPARWADISSRWSLWAMEAKALIGLVVNFGYRRRQGMSDTVFTALRGYAIGTTKQELALADGAIATTTTQYLRATYQFEMGRSEPLEDACIENFIAHLTYEEDAGTGREPTWTVV
jgi:hypothetical protein